MVWGAVLLLYAVLWRYLLRGDSLVPSVRDGVNLIAFAMVIHLIAYGLERLVDWDDNRP